MDVGCEFCDCTEFRFDNRHVICKKCGMVASTRGSMDKEHKDAPTLAEMASSRWKARQSTYSSGLQTWYRNMKGFRHVL